MPAFGGIAKLSIVLPGQAAAGDSCSASMSALQSRAPQSRQTGGWPDPAGNGMSYFKTSLPEAGREELAHFSHPIRLCRIRPIMWREASSPKPPFFCLQPATLQRRSGLTALNGIYTFNAAFASFKISSISLRPVSVWRAMSWALSSKS